MANVPRGEWRPEVRKQAIFVRKAFGWSQAQLAKELGVTPLTILNWEHRRVTPDKFAGLNKLVKIANQLVRYRKGQPLQIQDDEKEGGEKESFRRKAKINSRSFAQKTNQGEKKEGG